MRLFLVLMTGLLVACHPAEKKEQQKTEKTLPFLTLKTQQAHYALPFCEKKNCIDIDIQTLATQDQWLNQWIEKQQSKVVQAQIGLNQNLTLQQSVDRYVKKSDAWQQEFSANHPYQLHLTTRIASQRHQYVLLQLNTNTKQAEIEVNDRLYFAVADRIQHKTLNILDVIQPAQQTGLDKIVQNHYQQWLIKQTNLVQQKAPKKLYWGQADWFFDGEGIGLHYRTSEIAEGGQQFDLYLNREQTKSVLQLAVFQSMFT